MEMDKNAWIVFSLIASTLLIWCGLFILVALYA